MFDYTKKVGVMSFDNKSLVVYSSLDDPYFKASAVADILGYSDMWEMLGLCEKDEVFATDEIYLHERGLYNAFYQCRNLTARKWRRVISNELINLRRSRNYDIYDQFEEWDHALDDIYFDEETGAMMQSITTQGGDVVQAPYGGDCE